jgi:long-chain fatty acid transport protein
MSIRTRRVGFGAGPKSIKSTLQKVVLFLLGTIIWSASAQAGGLFLSEIGTPDLGLASAGYAARAQDASTVFTNPAGMTRLDESQLLVGVQPIYAHEVFTPNNQTTTGGTDGGNAIIPLPGASIFFVYSLTPDLKLGIGNCTYFGGALEYNTNWVGRYYLQGATILGSSLLPSIAYRVNKWLSVGGGFNIMVGYLKERVGINTLLVRNSDAQMSVKDWTAGIGGDIGVLVEPDSKTRFGIQYLTPVSLDFSDVPHFSGLGPGLVHLFKKRGIFGAPLDLSMTVPQSLLFSAYHEFTSRFALMGNVGWQNWSQFGNLGIGINSAKPHNATVNLRYQDTFDVALGTQFKVSDPLMLSAGFAFDNSMVSSTSRTVAAPIGNQWRFGLGAQYALNKAMTLGAGYEFQWQGDLGLYQSANRIQGTVAGRFSNVNINFFNINFIWRFGSTAT